MKDKITFSFGKNWEKFLNSLDEQAVGNAELSLTEFLGLQDLQGKSFLDIGCGSGLFSYAALNLGADKVVSFDSDIFSVECCKYLRMKAGNPKNWEIHKGSILDTDFIFPLGKFDIVYSWGVLHHTGKMWEAVKISAGSVKEGGHYYIAIYNKVEGRRGSETWLKIKRLYNSSGGVGKRILELLYIGQEVVVTLTHLKNPLSNIRNYHSKRGMNFRTDVTDWLGGYPYEFATVEEIFTFVKDKYPDFNLVNIKTTNSVGNNWYSFRRNKSGE